MDLEKLDSIINELNNQSNNLVEFNKVYAEIAKFKNDISESIQLLENNNSTLSGATQELKIWLEDSYKQIEKLETVLNTKIKEIYDDNKKYQKELDSSIFSRLEKHKSDIQLEIRDEGKQMQRIFESILTSSFNSMTSKFDERFQEQKKLFKKQNILIVAIIIIILVSIGVQFFY
ncbi:MAG: hypothetical protein STSR0008_22030 [Ignavibacterium sp.]